MRASGASSGIAIRNSFSSATTTSSILSDSRFKRVRSRSAPENLHDPLSRRGRLSILHAAAARFAGRRLRNIAHERDAAQHEKDGPPSIGEVENLFFGRFHAAPHLYFRARRFAEARVGRAVDNRLLHRRVSKENFFEALGMDLYARDIDDVRRAADDAVVAVG